VNKKDIASSGRVSSYQLLVFGAGGLIPIALFNIAGQLMGLMGNISLGLSAFWLGTILVIPRLWDAVSDPIVGYMTDHTRTRWGRRRPFVLVGGIAVSLSFVMMWWIPGAASVQALFPTESAYKWFQLSYILFSLLLFFTACTIFEIPHGALGMEMSQNPHERTRLFSAKSFFGNLFAMGTPWLFALAGMEIFKGPGGTEMDGMRYVSMLVAAFLIPASIWWFLHLKEPDAPAERERVRSNFWADMRHTGRNKNFMLLVAVVFTLAMGFNFVGLLNYYISIFYLFGGDKSAAGPLLGINGTIWAIVGLAAVFPLNWMSPRIGKRNTLIFSILMMCLAQISKIFCYDPARPYLVIIPTVLLSAGMLFFFTLGSSMVGDVCDEDELKTGKRAEGTYYSVFWWFIKIGTAFASFVMGLLIVFSQFDETQVTRVDALKGSVAEMRAAEPEADMPALFTKTELALAALRSHLSTRAHDSHTQALNESASRLERALVGARSASDPALIRDALGAKEVSDALLQLTKQSPDSLFRMRVIEIALPILLCVVSLLFALQYPLNDQRCREIQLALAERRKSR
jgi:GPH family glycoside/pentoside/hexuronide:cation symporter